MKRRGKKISKHRMLNSSLSEIAVPSCSCGHCQCIKLHILQKMSRLLDISWCRHTSDLTQCLVIVPAHASDHPSPQFMATVVPMRARSSTTSAQKQPRVMRSWVITACKSAASVCCVTPFRWQRTERSADWTQSACQLQRSQAVLLFRWLVGCCSC